MSGGCSLVLVCVKGKTCQKRDSDKVFKSLKKTVEKNSLEDVFKVKKADCFGLCKHGPIVSLDENSYGGVDKEACADIVKHHMRKRKPIKRLLVSRKGKTKRKR